MNGHQSNQADTNTDKEKPNNAVPSHSSTEAEDFEKRVSTAVEIRMKEATSWRNKSPTAKLGFLLQNALLLVSFALSVWQGFDRQRAQRAQVQTAEIANKSLAVAIDSKAVAQQLLQAAEKGNNLTATQNNLTAVANNLTAMNVDDSTREALWNVYMWCSDHPGSNMNFTNMGTRTNCSNILSTPFAIPSARPTALLSGGQQNVPPGSVGMALLLLVYMVGSIFML